MEPGIKEYVRVWHPGGSRVCVLLCKRSSRNTVYSLALLLNFLCSAEHLGYIQACRGLMIAAVSLGFFGSVFALFGMKCTKVGGSEKSKAKIACLAGIVFILSGLCSMTGCSLYANKITTEFFDPLFVEQKYELGAALFIGWAGASLCIIGGVIFCFSISDNNKTPRMGYAYNGATSIMSSRTKYHGGEGDFKTTSPSKQFDKNAYV
ncbi:claudin-10 isoform X4 [Heterocephalus glaber]|uniref:Claudin-10 isoform X4 n=1 Tax=Heterocephalus glaber TaxID=10181 RepID=A0AAX6S7U8_HETGA|nr:claudin-10 isoform X4 [Heterocephalus glaber]